MFLGNAPVHAGFKTLNVADFAGGVVVDERFPPHAQYGAQITDCTAWAMKNPRGNPPGSMTRYAGGQGPVCHPQNLRPVPLVRCVEANLNRSTGEWSCVRTGESCVAGTCTAPEQLTTWVEDFSEGVMKLPVTPAGEVIFPDVAPSIVTLDDAVDSGVEIVARRWWPVGIAAVGLFGLYLLRGR